MSSLWDSCRTIEDTKKALLEMIVLPVKFPQIFKDRRRPPSCFLLYGPEGTDSEKLEMIRDCAREGGFTIMSPTGFLFDASDLVPVLTNHLLQDLTNIVMEYAIDQKDWFVDEKVEHVFLEAKKKKHCILILDGFEVTKHINTTKPEVDRKAYTEYRKAHTELLVQLDSIDNRHEDNDLVVALTNAPWDIPSTTLRRVVPRLPVLPEKLENLEKFERFLTWNVTN